MKSARRPTSKFAGATGPNRRALPNQGGMDEKFGNHIAETDAINPYSYNVAAANIILGIIKFDRLNGAATVS